MDCHLGAAVLVPGLRPHDEPLAGLAASVALVRGNSDHRSVIPAFDFEGADPRHQPPLRAYGWR